MRVKEDKESPFYIWFNEKTKREFYSAGLFLCSTSRHDEDNNSMILKLTNSIKNYKDKDMLIKHPSYINSPYVERFGNMLIMFLNANFKDFNTSYDTFFHLYGFELLNEYMGVTNYITRFNNFDEYKKYYTELLSKINHKLVKMQNDFRNTVNIVYNLDDENLSDDIKPLSKLIALVIKDENNLDEYSNNIDVESERYPSSMYDYKSLNFKELASIVNNGDNVKFETIYSSKYLGSICYVVLREIASSETFAIKKCKCCGRYFMPYIRSDEVYCDIENIDGSSTCRELGAKETYRENLKNVPALLEYRRSYQKKLMYCSRNKEDKKLKEEFDKWRKEAQSRIKQFKKGNLSQEELLKWMIENK